MEIKRTTAINLFLKLFLCYFDKKFGIGPVGNTVCYS